MSDTATLEPDTITADPDLDEAWKSFLENEDSPDEDESDGGGDHERFSHYASKEDIARSAVTRTPIVALCGKKWTPRKNPENFPVCPDCKSVYEKMRDE